MGRAAYLRVGEAHIERPARGTTIARMPYRLRLLGVFCACVLALAGAAQAAPRGNEALGVKLARALRAPGVSRSAAVAVELSTGKVV